MNHSLELGYVGVEVSDLKAFEGYLDGVLGLLPGEPAHDGTHTWRMDGKAHRFIVAEGSRDDITVAGLVATSEAHFHAALERLRGAGYDPETLSAEAAATRRVKALASVLSPFGVTFELSWGLAETDVPFDSPLVPGGFLTEGLGLGHTVLYVAGGDAGREAADRFVVEGLGMSLSDDLDLVIGDQRIRGNFYHCNGRHHTIALAFLPFPVAPKLLDHIMIESVSEDNVGHAYDRALAADVPIVMDLGKHPNDRMFSFYGQTPAGFNFEFGAGAVQVDDSWKVVTYDRISAWGHHPGVTASS